MKRLNLMAVCAMSLVTGPLAAEGEAAPVAAPNVQPPVLSLEQRMARIELQLQSQAAMTLLKEVEGLKAELSRLRGQAEQQEHQLGQLERRQKDLYIDLDKRVDELGKQVKAIPVMPQPAPQPVIAVPVPDPGTGKSAAVAVPASAPAPKQEPAPPAKTETAKADSGKPESAPRSEPSRQATTVDPLAESKTYESALNAFRAGNHANAVMAFKSFLKDYPDSSLAPNAAYWLGYSLYAQKDYKGALEQQKRTIAIWPQSAKVPDAMLNMANCMIELDDLNSARKTLEDIVARFQGTNAAAIAGKKLTLLKQ